MEDKQPLKNGDITGIEVWCETCQAAHVIPVEVILMAAFKGEKNITNKIGDQLAAYLAALTFMMAPTESYQSSDSGFIKTYTQGDLNKLSHDDLFRNFSI